MRSAAASMRGEKSDPSTVVKPAARNATPLNPVPQPRSSSGAARSSAAFASASAQRRGEAMGLDSDQIDKGRCQFDQGHLAVAVVEVQKPSEKIPALEQTYSAGCVCLALLNAALASGWGANWLSGWPSHDRGFMQDALGLADHDRIAGFVHIGTETSTPPERPRPDLDSITSWVCE